jgi:hypothetical protein
VNDGEIFFLKEVKAAQAGIRFFFQCPSPKKKGLKLWRLPKIEDFMERWSASPFGSPI